MQPIDHTIYHNGASLLFFLPLIDLYYSCFQSHMDSAPRKQQKRRLSESLEMSSPNSTAVGGAASAGRDDELQKTPSRNTSGRVGKRKLQTTPTTAKDELDKTPSAKKRRSSSTQGGIGSPSSITTPLKPALTERQQLALLLQMTDPQKTPGGSSVESSPRDTPTRSRIHRKNERGETPLHLACIKGDKKTASSLIQQGADVNATDFAGWTPLHEACNHGYNDIVVLLINSGAYVNASGMGGDTPLHDAVVNNHVEVVELLLKHGADSTLHNDNGQQPLDVCRDKKVSRLLRSAMGERMEGDEDKEEKDDDEDVFLSKSETPGGPSSPLSMPSLQTSSEHVLSTFTTPVMKKQEPQSVPTARTPQRPASPQRKSSHGSFYSDISSETDHEHSHQGIASSSSNIETTPTVSTPTVSCPVLDKQKDQVSNEAKAQVALSEDTGHNSEKKEEKRHYSPVEKPSGALFPPGVRRSLVHSMREEEKENTSESMDVSEEAPQSSVMDASPSKEDAATLKVTDDQPLTKENTLEQQAAVSITSPTTTSPAPTLSLLTNPSQTSSPPSSPFSLTVSVSLDLLPQRRVASESSIHKDTSRSSKLLLSSRDVALRRIKDRERRSASVGMTPSLLDEDTRDASYQSLHVSRRRRRQGSFSLDSSAVVSSQDNFAFEDDDSSSTVVSLPILFSSRLQQSPSPSHHGSSPCLVTRETTPLSTHAHQKDETTPSAFSLASSLTQTVASSKTSPILPSSTRGSIYKDKEEEEHPLPPKKQHLRPIVRSIVVQQRRQSTSLPPPPLPHNVSSFLLSTQQYKTRSLPHPIDPKCVYPPIPSALHKLFTDQEAERVALLTSHFTDLDRIVLSFEQALVRAHQRAAVCGYPPLSACSVLLERMMPTTKTSQSNLENTCLNTSSSDDRLQSTGDSDEKLLVSYVRDVWDRFHGCSKDLLRRHHLEEETLWLTQAHQWRKTLSSSGESASIIIPSSHVPLAHHGNYPNHTL